VLTPDLGDAGTTSWLRSANFLQSFDPMSPLPPMMTSFMIAVPFRVDPILGERAKVGAIEKHRQPHGLSGNDHEISWSFSFHGRERSGTNARTRREASAQLLPCRQDF